MAFQSNNKKISNELNGKLQKSHSLKTNIRKNAEKHRKSDSNQKHPTIAFIRKSDNESNKLKTKLSNELLKQLTQLFESEDFADTLIIRGKYRKRVHFCLLLTRIPELITKLLNLNINRNAINPKTNEYSVKIPPEIKESELKVLLENIYSDYSVENMANEEKDLISKIEILSKNYIKDESSQDLQQIDETNDEKSNLDLNEVQNKSEELDSYEDSDDKEVMETSTRTNQMVRSGTFELLTSIYSDDNIQSTEDIKNEENIIESENKVTEMSSKKLNNDMNEETNETMNKSMNSMFSLFIDINQTSDEVKPKERPKTNREDKRKGFDFIPLNGRLNVSKSGVPNQRRARNSADALLMRSLDSAIPGIQTVGDIPLLPMSPIVRSQQIEPEEGIHIKNKYQKNRRTHPKEMLRSTDQSMDRSSSDSFSEAFNECLNISVQSSTKNSYETDSIDFLDDNECKNDFVYDSDESDVSEKAVEVNNDLDFSDTKTIRNLKSCSKLGEDLLKMFVQQINSDIIIKVMDREIKAHKCILTSRSHYFNAMLKGNWMESDTNYVDLQGFTYNSVYFALCHIYSGCLTLPPQMDLSELALLSDVLAMDSLKEIVVHELLVNRCHFFHSPCSDNCMVSIIKCLKLCYRSNLKDLYNKCLNWTAKHFTKVWTNKSFASLKPHLMDACFKTKVNHLLAENILKTTLECERLITATPRVKWAEPVLILLAKLIEECCHFIAINYDEVITSKDFLALGRGNSWDISNLEQTLLAAMTKLTPDVSCKSLIELNKILLLQESDQMSDPLSYGPFNDQFARLVTKMVRYCERYMIQNANHLVHCQSWTLLSQESQQKIKDGAVIVFEFERPIAPPPKLSSRLSNYKKKSNDNSRLNESNAHQSKGAVPKNLVKNNRSKSDSMNIRPNNPKQILPNQSKEQHIYDSVPFEDISTKNIKENKRTVNKMERVSNKALSLHLNNRRVKEKVAKVSPFSVKTQTVSEPKPESTESGSNSKDLFAEIDAETNLVTYCLQEAELLEQELTRKIQKSQSRAPPPEVRSSLTSASGSTSHQTNSKSVVSHPKDNIRKTNPKSQSTSSSVHKSRAALPKTQNQRK